MKDAKWVVLLAITVGFGVVAGVLTYLDYTSKVAVIEQVKELKVKHQVEAVKQSDGSWVFTHCTPTNSPCGRLE